MTAQLKPCPFCGRQPKVDSQLPRHNEFDAWTHIMCNCDARPHVGVARAYMICIDRYSWEAKQIRTEQEASDEATKEAIERWNRRASNPAPVEQAAPDQRTRFETAHCGGNKHTCRRNEHGDYVLPSVQDAWAGWQSCSSQAAPVTVPIAWGDVVKAIRAVDDEARQRGSMFPQEADEHAVDRAATRRVVEMIKWYATCGGAVAEKLKDWPRYTLAAAPALSADAQDAKRYRILRDSKYQRMEDDPCVTDDLFNTFFDEDLDKAVDALESRYAALSAQKEGE